MKKLEAKVNAEMEKEENKVRKIIKDRKNKNQN